MKGGAWTALDYTWTRLCKLFPKRRNQSNTQRVIEDIKMKKSKKLEICMNSHLFLPINRIHLTNYCNDVYCTVVPSVWFVTRNRKQKIQSKCIQICFLRHFTLQVLHEPSVHCVLCGCDGQEGEEHRYWQRACILCCHNHVLWTLR